MSDVQQTQELPPTGLAQPGPVGFALGSLMVPDGSKVTILRLEHTAGSTVVCLPNDLANQLGQQLIQQTSGITLATAADLPKV